MTGTRGQAAMDKLQKVYKAVKNGQQTMDDLEYISNFMYSGINLNLIAGSVTKGREIREYYGGQQQ